MNCLRNVGQPEREITLTRTHEENKVSMNKDKEQVLMCRIK